MSSQLKTAVLVDDSAIVDGNTIDAVDHTVPFDDVQAQLREGQLSVSADDTHVKHLEDALGGTTGQIKLSTQNPGANESLDIGIDADGVTSGFVLTANGAGGTSWAASGGGGAQPVDLTATAAEALAERDYVYLDESTGTWFKVDTDVTPIKCGRLRGIVNEAGGISSSSTGSVRLIGEVSGFSGLTAWSPVYASTTPGSYTQTRPSPTSGGAQIAVIMIGMAISTTNIVVLTGNPVQYMKRDTVADEGTLTVAHHTDEMAQLRRAIAYIGSSESGVIVQQYTSTNYDADVNLRSDDPLKTNLEAWWTLNEASGTRADSHGSNDLTDNNTVGSAAGKQDTAADLEAANSEFLSIIDNASLSTGNVDFTFGGWFNFESLVNFMTLASKRNSPNATREWQLFIDGSNVPTFTIYDGVGGSDTVTSSTGAVSTSTWYYIMIWHDAATSEIGISVNGTETTDTSTINPNDGNAPFRLGINEGTSYFDGLIDEAAFWKRILTSTEKTRLINSGNGVTYADLTEGINDKLAQTFTLGSSTDISSVTLYLKKVGTPTGTLTCRIETTSSGEPTGTLADGNATATYSEASLATSYAEVVITFSSSFTLAAGTYAIVLSTDRGSSDTNFVQWGADESSPSFSGGEMYAEQVGSYVAENKDAIFTITGPGTTFIEPAALGRWSGGTRDIAIRNDNGSGSNPNTNTTCKNVIGASADVTLVVEVP